MNRLLVVVLSIVALLTGGCTSPHQSILSVRGNISPQDVSDIAAAVSKHTTDPVVSIKISGNKAEAYTRSQGRKSGGIVYAFRRESGRFQECGSASWD